MSHFTVMVIGDNPENQLALYDENLKVPHIKTKEEHIAKIREDISRYEKTSYAQYLADPEKYEANTTLKVHLNYIKNEFPKKLKWTDEECYQEAIKWYDKDKINKDGSTNETYNPKSKWDWYALGGRWGGLLRLKDGNLKTNKAYKGDIANLESIRTYAVVKDGEWFEKGKMGWWGLSSETEEEVERWDKEFYNRFLKDLSNDILISIFDCHI